MTIGCSAKPAFSLLIQQKVRLLLDCCFHVVKEAEHKLEETVFSVPLELRYRKCEFSRRAISFPDTFIAVKKFLLAITFQSKNSKLVREDGKWEFKTLSDENTRAHNFGLGIFEKSSLLPGVKRYGIVVKFEKKYNNSPIIKRNIECIHFLQVRRPLSYFLAKCLYCSTVCQVLFFLLKCLAIFICGDLKHNLYAQYLIATIKTFFKWSEKNRFHLKVLPLFCLNLFDSRTRYCSSLYWKEQLLVISWTRFCALRFYRWSIVLHRVVCPLFGLVQKKLT